MYARHTRHIRTFLPFALVLLVWLLPLTASAGVGTEIGKFIYEAVVAATGTLLTVAAYIFESALTHFVWGFGQYYREFFGFAIETTWAVVRDLMNFMFIFGLIYIGFRFILNADDSQAKNNLVMLILAALLVNFSLFFAKAIVDISHLAAQQLQAPIETVSGDTDISYGDALLNSLQITSILSDDVIGGRDDVPFMWIIGVTILSGALILVAAFTLAALGIMLFTRFIYLTFLLIFSPVMFIGWIFPGLRGLSSKWLNTFLSQAFLAPALLLCLYISLSMIALIGQINGVGDEPLTSLHGAPVPEDGDATTVGNAAKNAVPFFILGIGFFIGSLVAAKKMGAVGANASISFGKKIGNKARGYVQRGATAPIRYPARAVTNYAGEKTSKGLTSLQSSDSWAGSIARTNTADRMIRGTSEAAANARFGTVATNKENRDYARGIQTRANQQRAVDQREQEFNSHLDVLNNTNATAAELNTAFEDLGKTIKNMTKEEKEQLSHEQLTSEHIALNLSDKDIEGLESSGKFSPQQIEDIRDSRKNAFNSVASNGSTLNPNANYTGNTAALRNTQRAALVTRSSEEVGNMSVDVFTNPDMVEHLTPAMVEQRMRNGRITNAQLQTIRTNIQNHITNPNTPQRTTDMWTHWSTNTTYGAQLGL